MTTIEIENIHCRVVNGTTRALWAIDEALAVMTPNSHFNPRYKSGQWDGMTRFFSVATKKFPTGLISEVIIALRRAGEKYKLEDKRDLGEDPLIGVGKEITLLDSNRGTITLRDYQWEAVTKSLEATRGLINVATNGGKTEIACGILKLLLPQLSMKKKMLFFTHSKEIFYQSHKRLEERLGVKVGMIGDEIWEEQPITLVMIPTVGKYISVPKELPKNAKRTKLEKEIARLGKTDPVKVKELRDTITAIESEDWARIKGNVKKTKALMDSCIGFIADEVHHASSTTWYDVFMKMSKAYYRFGLTGTIDEDAAINVKRLLGCTGRVTSKISNQFLISEGFSAKPTINMLTVACAAYDEGGYREAYENGIIYNEVRNMAFLTKVVERAETGNQCLIIVNETSHGEELLSYFQAWEMDGVVFTHGDRTTKFRQKALSDFKEGKTPILIATSILDEGVDISGINCLFLMAGGKSMRQLLQRIGRGLRKKADGGGIEVFDALDYHNKYLAEHTLERYETYKAEGFDVQKC